MRTIKFVQCSILCFKKYIHKFTSAVEKLYKLYISFLFDSNIFVINMGNSQLRQEKKTFYFHVKL